MLTDGMIHDALTDDADWDAEYWDFDQEKLQDAKRMVTREYEQSAEGIRVAINWVSVPVEKDINETVESLINWFNCSKIGTRERYTLRKG